MDDAGTSQANLPVHSSCCATSESMDMTAG